MISRSIWSWVLLVATPCSVQVQCHGRLEELCQCGSATPLLAVLDSLERSMGLDTALSCGAEEVLARELIADYWIRHLSLTWKTTPKQGQNVELWLVTAKDHTVQWYISAGVKVLDVHIDTTAFERLNTVYQKVYEREVEPSELFQSQTAQYGKACGIVGMPPVERKVMEDFVAKQDELGLNRWLASPEVELQLYAMEGLMKMRAAGYELTPFQERCIGMIRKKKGNVMTCSGCIVLQCEIASVVKQIRQ